MYLVHTFTTEQEARAHRAANGTGGLIFVPDDPAYETVLFPPEVSPADALRHPLVRDRAGQLLPDEIEPGSDAWYRITARTLFEVDDLIEIPEFADIERDEQDGKAGAWVTARVWFEEVSVRSGGTA